MAVLEYDRGPVQHEWGTPVWAETVHLFFVHTDTHMGCKLAAR
jgi:hypothetical protein